MLCCCQDIDNRQAVCNIFGFGVCDSDLKSLMVPALGAYTECVLVSLLTDDELDSDAKRVKVESVLAKLQKHEAVYGQGALQDIMHKVIMSEATAVALAKQ